MTTTEPATDPNFFAVNRPGDPIAQLQIWEQRFEYLKWRAILPADPETEARDFTEYAATLTRSTGQTANFIADNLAALVTLDQLPGLRKIVETRFHVDMRRLRTIEFQTKGVHADIITDPEFWECLDTSLVLLFTPTRPQQLVPESAKIIKAVKEVVRAFTPDEEDPATDEDSTGDSTEPTPEDSTDEEELEFSAGYQSWQQPDGSVIVELRTDQATATMIEEAVRTRAAAQDVSRATALTELILANVAVSVALNLFQASDLPEAPGFLQPYGPLSPADTGQLAEIAKVIRDVDEAGKNKGKGYRPGADIRAHVEGRDRICRWPGCQVPAHLCQLDHRMNYTDGGETTATEMISLCQRHHNRKTDEQACYLLDPATGDVYWLFGDGTWAVDRADGPLAPRQKRWTQTLSQRLRARRERAQQKAHRRPRPKGKEMPPF
ncbi:HNH endonuclease signature motif containing protein [Corynebacterium halotolerans]|uniref:HNH endonuclease signature motif containing protein n=1 Tax=Corynebacterium halotolerans TaxID=225326 RepID=UPI003CF21C73